MYINVGSEGEILKKRSSSLTSFAEMSRTAVMLDQVDALR